MSLTLYDKAITEKIKAWVLDPNMTVLAPDETTRLFQWKADIQNDKPLQLPFITIKRNRDITIRDTGNKALTRAGKVFNSVKGISDHLNAVPISISYTINIYTRYLEQADEYVRNFVFNFINYSAIVIKIPYNDSPLTYTSFITLQENITDNSDIPERLVPGQFSRLTLNIALNDAYLFSYNHRRIPKVENVQIENKVPDQDNPGTSNPSEDVGTGGQDDEDTSSTGEFQGDPCELDDIEIII